MDQSNIMRCVVITLFPQSLAMLQETGITGRAHNHLWQLYTINPRQYSQQKHARIDDRPYGGGPGMVMQAPPLRDSILAAKELLKNPKALVVYVSPQGYCFSQQLAQQLADGLFERPKMKTSLLRGDKSPIESGPNDLRKDYIFLCGRYEGVDERLLRHYVDFEISIGDYILSGGEIAVMAIIDAVVRLLPSACGHQQSAAQDSFSTPMLDHEQYTRPEVFDGHKVPAVLLGGDHQAIASWRRHNALARTQRLRPDLLKQPDVQ